MPRGVQARTVAAVLLIAWTSAPATAASGVCDEPTIGTDRVPLLSPPLDEIVVGKGRLPFYSAPNLACRMAGVFVVPRDRLIAYAQTDDGWTSVMYATSGVRGWVRSSRLKATGTMGPSQ